MNARDPLRTGIPLLAREDHPSETQRPTQPVEARVEGRVDLAVLVALLVRDGETVHHGQAPRGATRPPGDHHGLQQRGWSPGKRGWCFSGGYGESKISPLVN